MADNLHNMDPIDNIIFTKVNLINLLGFLGLIGFDFLHYVSGIASEIIPIVTVIGGMSLAAYNGIKAYKELFSKKRK